MMTVPCLSISPRLWRTALLLAVLALMAGVAMPQTDGTIFVDRVDVELVNVEVWVSDKDGRPVSGLSLDDFELYEDGEQREIANFYTGESTIDDLGAVPVALDVDAEPTGAASRREPFSLVVYVDHFNLLPQNRHRILAQLESFLDARLAAGDRVMVVGYRGHLELVQPFTDDRQILADALAGLEEVATHRQIEESRRSMILRLMTRAQSQEEAYGYLVSFRDGLLHDLERSTSALETLVRSLGGVAGRKVLLYISDGLPQRPAEELYVLYSELSGGLETGGGSPRGVDAELLGLDQNALFRRIAQAANANQVVITTLDARGQQAVSPPKAGRVAVPLDLSLLTYETSEHMNRQQPLLALADETGGRSILNTSHFAGAFERLSDDLTAFYSLGFHATRSGSTPKAPYKKLKIKVKKPGLTVRHRRGYALASAEQQTADLTLASLLLDETENPLAIRIELGEPEKGSWGEYLLPCLIRVPVESVQVLPNGEREEGRLQVFVAVRDDQGRLSKVRRIPYPLSAESNELATAQEKDVGYFTRLRVRSGTLQVSAGVLDEISGERSVVQRVIEVGADASLEKK